MAGTTAPGAPGAAEEPASAGFEKTLPLIIAIFAIFYLMMIRPQAKEKKKRDALLQGVKKHDRVVTTAGLHGEVVAVTETTITLRVDDDVRLTFDRSAIWQVKPKDGESPPEPTVPPKDGKDAKASKSAAAPATSAPKEKGKA